MCDDNIIRAKELFIVFTYLVGDFMNIFSVLFSFLFIFTSFTFFSQQRVFSISSFQESLILRFSTI